MDLNQDGHLDILSGSYSSTHDGIAAGYFYLLEGQADGTFSKPRILKGNDGENLIINREDSERAEGERICTRPFAVDWDSDGHLDLIVGTSVKSFYFFKGLGAGNFDPQAAILTTTNDEKPLLNPSVHSDPFVIDWDSDGDLDLISGGWNGGVFLATNEAGRGAAPRLSPFETLVAPPLQKIEFASQRPRPAGASRVWATDLNEDGKLDLLVGDKLVVHRSPEGKSDSETEKIVADIEERISALEAQAGGENKEEIAEGLDELQVELFYATKSAHTGRVWMYLQK